MSPPLVAVCLAIGKPQPNPCREPHRSVHWSVVPWQPMQMSGCQRGCCGDFGEGGLCSSQVQHCIAGGSRVADDIRVIRKFPYVALAESI